MLNSLFLAFADETAHAAGDADAHGTHAQVLDGANWLPGVTALVVFGIALLILSTKVWPKITRALDEREQKIRDEIAAAEAAREQANAALADYQRNLAKAREERDRMIAEARADAKAVADELRAKNEADLSEMKQRATREIEVARQAAVASLYDEASSLAVSIAGKILQREINSRDQQMLVEESIKELAKAGR